MKAFQKLGITLLALLAWSSVAISQAPFTKGTWTPVTSAPPFAVSHIMLLTDGSVLAFNGATCSTTGSATRLVPDNTGNYANGTWVSAGNLPGSYNPLYFASAVMPSGHVVVMGGEYNACSAVWTNLGAHYNPISNSWSSVPAPTGWTTVGDAQSVILPTSPNAQLMIANCCTTQEAILTSLSPITWTATGTGKADWNDEEGWTLLPGGDLLTVDTYVNTSCCAMGWQLYSPSTGAWTNGPGTTGVNLVDPGSRELGPGILRPDGTVFYGGATTNNAIYNSSTQTWAAAPAFGSGLDMADAPGALLPDGNVLLDTSPGIFNLGSVFFEWDGTNLNQTSAPPNAGNDSSYYGNFVCLPSGQILFSDFSSDVEVYTPSGSANGAWAPTISAISSTTLTHGKANYKIRGTQFNGMSQCAFYGDDNQMASNWPLVRITNSGTGHVFYARTHGWSGGVQTGSTSVRTEFDVPSGIETGASTLEVVANGIASAPINVTVN